MLSLQVLGLVVVMATGLRIEDRLDGVVNFIPLKARIVLIMQENELWDIVNSTQAHLFADKFVFDKKDIIAKIIILDVLKDHVIPHVTGKNHAHQT